VSPGLNGGFGFKGASDDRQRRRLVQAAIRAMGHLQPDRPPVGIASGEIFRIEVAGELKLTRMEFRHFAGPLKGRELMGHTGEYYSFDGYWLRNGVRAAIGEEG
jgi:hypothetical protein